MGWRAASRTILDTNFGFTALEREVLEESTRSRQYVDGFWSSTELANSSAAVVPDATIRSDAFRATSCEIKNTACPFALSLEGA
jgi:hypothetical protein